MSKVLSPEATKKRVEFWKARIYRELLSNEERKRHYLEISGADRLKAHYTCIQPSPSGRSHYAELLDKIDAHKSNANSAEALDELAVGHLVGLINEKDVKLIQQVDKDIYRTAENLVVDQMDNALYKERCEQLRRVLEAYCLHNRAIGYCQSMNFVAWNILEVFEGDEEAAFWVLATLAESHFPSYWVPSMIGMHVDMVLLDKLALERAPEGFRALDEMGLPLQTASPQWLLSLLLGVLPTAAGLAVLDCVLLEGRTALLACCLAFVKTLEQELVEAAQFGGDLEDAMHILTEHRGHQLMAARWSAPGTMRAFLQIAENEREYILSEDVQAELRELRAIEFEKYHAVAESVNEDVVKRDAMGQGLLDEEFEFIYKTFIDVATEPGDTPDLRHLNFEQFKAMLNACVPRWAEDENEMSILFEAFDADGNGVIDVSELISGIRFLDANCTSSTKMKFLFHLYDRDCNNRIGRSEFKSMLTNMTRHLGVNFPSEQLDSHVNFAMRHAQQLRDISSPRSEKDADGREDVELTFEEFCEVLQTIPLF